jgi:hypothetical protein
MDVCYQNLASDPVDTVRAIYGRFGLHLSYDAESRMKAFAAAERNKNRSDRFSLADFDLDPAQNSPTFDHYCERFGIEREEL